MLAYVVLLALCGICSGNGDWTEENPNDDKFMGIAWNAAASVVNRGLTTGRFMVPKKLMEVRKRVVVGTMHIEIIGLFQEAWCGPWEGNTVDEICEGMCPLYHNGAEAIYKINSIGTQITATKIEDVQPAPVFRI